METGDDMKSIEGKADEEFWGELLKHLIDDGRRIPKFQVERAIGPVLGFFLDKAISDLIDSKGLFGSKGSLKSEMVTLASEFPLIKQSNEGKEGKQSTNIDWLMFDKTSGELLLLELKTDSSSFHAEQLKIYLTLAATECPWNGIRSNPGNISPFSKSKQKYITAQKNLEDISASCKGIEGASLNVLYLAPLSIKSGFEKALGELAKDYPALDLEKRIAFCSFDDLRNAAGEKLSGEFALYRKQLYDALIQLDSPVDYDA